MPVVVIRGGENWTDRADPPGELVGRVLRRESVVTPSGPRQGGSAIRIPPLIIEPIAFESRLARHQTAHELWAMQHKRTSLRARPPMKYVTPGLAATPEGEDAHQQHTARHGSASSPRSPRRLRRGAEHDVQDARTIAKASKAVMTGTLPQSRSLPILLPHSTKRSHHQINVSHHSPRRAEGAPSYLPVWRQCLGLFADGNSQSTAIKPRPRSHFQLPSTAEVLTVDDHGGVYANSTGRDCERHGAWDRLPPMDNEDLWGAGVTLPSENDLGLTKAEIIEHLGTLKWFQCLSSAQLRGLYSRGRLKSAARYTTIIREGCTAPHPRGCFYLLLQGQVRVTSEEFGISFLLPNSAGRRYFGEAALVASVRREGTITAMEDCQLLTFTAEQIQGIPVDLLEVRTTVFSKSMRYARTSYTGALFCLVLPSSCLLLPFSCLCLGRCVLPG